MSWLDAVAYGPLERANGIRFAPTMATLRTDPRLPPALPAALLVLVDLLDAVLLDPAWLDVAIVAPCVSSSW